MKFYITCRRSENTGNEYLVLIAKCDEREIFVTFDVKIMCRLSGKTMRELYQLELDEVINI